MNVQTQAKLLAALEAHGGVLTPTNALPLGISRQLLTEARDLGLVERPRRGVYVTPGLPLVVERATAEGIGSPVLLSHRGAGGAYGYDGVQPGILEWSIPHTRKKPMPRVYLRRRFDELEFVERDGLLITSPEQTLADLGYVIDADHVERAVESAIRKGDTTDRLLREFAMPASRRPGAPTLRLVLTRRPVGAPPTGSDAETLLLQAYRRGGVPEPLRQFELFDGDVFVAQIDFHWSPIPFGVEVDGFAAHGTPTAFQYDLTRANNIGDTQHFIRRFTYADITKRPTWVCRKTLRGLAVTQALLTNGRRKRRMRG